MRLIVLSLSATFLYAGIACAQVTIIPQDGPDSARDEMNILPEDNLSWEEAADHRDITVVRPGPDGLQAVSPEDLTNADKSKFLQQRKAVRRLDDQAPVTFVEGVPPELFCDRYGLGCPDIEAIVIPLGYEKEEDVKD